MVALLLTVNAPLTRRESLKVQDALTNIPAVDEVGVKALVKRISQAPGEPAWATPVTERAPPVMVKLVPVMSVIGKSLPTWIWVRSSVVVALSLELNSLWKPAQVEVALNWSAQK